MDDRERAILIAQLFVEYDECAKYISTRSYNKIDKLKKRKRMEQIKQKIIELSWRE
jgi:hypothetical protein